MNVDEMSERELDVLVAEIMGLQVIRPPFVPRDVTWNEKTVFTDEANDLWRQTYPGSAAVLTVPHYSTSIGDAWLVVKKLETIGINTVIWAQPAIVHTYRSDVDAYESEAKGETVPEAICKAALKAVSGKEK